MGAGQEARLPSDGGQVHQDVGDLPPISPRQIVETLCPGLKDKLIKITPVEKHTHVEQRNRFKAFIVIGGLEGILG
jgi:ribosomal protein S5